MIKISNISKNYKDVEALKSVSLEVRPNELFGLIGPDGAGKTTLIRILVSLILPDAGEAHMNGLNVVNDFKLIRKMVGYMPGRFSLYQDLTISENLAFFAAVFGTSIEENYDLIKDIYQQIEPFKNRRAGKLSGGMKQKLALSCALIHKPKVLVLDEPTTGVDAVSRKEFWDMLDNLKARGITIFVSTPYMDEASRCDRVALIQNGNILSVDTPEEIIKARGKTMWHVKSGDVYRLLLELKAWDKTDTVFPFGQFLHLSLKDETDKNEINEFLEENKHNDICLKKDFSGIEDVFMDLMSS